MIQYIEGKMLRDMFVSGANNLQNHKELVDKNGLYAKMWSEYRQSIDWKVGEFVCC